MGYSRWRKFIVALGSVMKIVLAIGGNALLRSGQALNADNQLQNIRRAAGPLARIAQGNDLVITHGNGPQIGLLALQSAACSTTAAYPPDLRGAQTDGMLGYLLEQELANLLPASRTVTTLLTRVEVDAQDPAFAQPTRFIGPVYSEQEAQRAAAAGHWQAARDGAGFRRVVASPQPLRVWGLDPIRWLLAHGAVVIAAGGGGMPVARGADGQLRGVDALIDQDLCSGLLAQDLQADCLLIATGVDAVYLDWGKPTQRALGKVTPHMLAQHVFLSGSMGPKVEAACKFVLATGKKAVIGSVDRVEEMLAGKAGTEVSPHAAVL